MEVAFGEPREGVWWVRVERGEGGCVEDMGEAGRVTRHEGGELVENGLARREISKYHAQFTTYEIDRLAKY